VKNLNQAPAFARVVFAALAGFASLIMLATPAYAASAADASQNSPQDMISDVSTRLFAALDAHRAALRKNPEAINPIVDQILNTPHSWSWHDTGAMRVPSSARNSSRHFTARCCEPTAAH